MNKIYELPLGALQTNCYILEGEDKKAVVIDPASSSEVLMFLNSKELTLGSIILTHGHFDHFAGVAELVRRTDCEVIGARLDEEMFRSAAKSWADFMPYIPFEPVSLDRSFADGDEFTACGITFRAMGTPGHTAGCCLLFCEDVIFAGDTLFNGSIGRTDGYSASGAEMQRSLRKISEIQGDYTVYSGHGSSTTLSFEKKYNPFLG
ncbi:MAG: MBL fold metallo-hydrolase [Oscillospiraceae bacterium]|nr:MBL fold metallo-hydrolase [Oscillospiraceae bacterium]